MRHHFLTMPLALVSAMAIVQQAHAEDFVVRDIQINGLVRLTPVNIYSMLPISSGDSVSEAQVSEAIRALYATGNFDDVKASRDNDTLVFNVIERPMISSINFEGNKLIQTPALQEGLERMGIKQGEVLDQSMLQNAENELEQQYVQQGRYNADIKVDSSPRDNNRVDLSFVFDEGTAAKVVDVNIIGNTVFSEKEILQAFAIKEKSWLSVITRNDRYAKERMNASLEAMRAMYLNKGYINFNIISSNLNLSEDKKKIFIEVSVDEGSQYRFADSKLLGDTLYSPEELKPLLSYQTNDVYSQAKVNVVKSLLERKYGNAGYYFTEVKVAPRIDEDNKTVELNYFINPGQKVTVRRINFTGNNKTADNVLRREMRQLEGSLASNEKIDLSKVRLERTGYFKSVNIQPARVANSPDQIDLNVAVEEQHSGTSTLAVGYSQGGGVTFQAGLNQRNFLGTGNSVGIDLSRSSTLDYYNLSVVDPYFTIDGVSRGYNVYYRKTKLDDDYNVNNYVTDSIGGSLTFGFPIDENQNVSASVNVDQTKVTTGPWVSTYVRDYMLANGGKTIDTDEYCPEGEYDSTAAQCNVANIPYDSEFEAEFLSYNLNLAWAYNTLNRPVFPTKGMYHRLSLDVAVPGGDVDYQRLVYDTQAYLPLGDKFTLRGHGRLGYGNDMPFYKNFFAGGYGSVRGYEVNTLGPRYESVYHAERGKEDPDPEEVGGNALVQGGVELVLPMPTKSDWARQFRPVIFAEGAQVFDTESSNSEDIDFNEMRFSAGVGFTWITMIGPLSLSYAFPLNEKDGDETQNVQFQIGRTF